MANVLGELFGDIASAIREKTGDEEKMKPAQFPVKIREIEGSAETEATSVDANFTVGDMVIQPSEGKLLEMVTVKKPADLIPENIKLGVDIAGIIGSLVSGGSGDSGSDSPSDNDQLQIKDIVLETDDSGSVAVNHGMGKMPDMVCIFYADFDTDGLEGEIANGTHSLASYAMKRKFNPDGVCQFSLNRVYGLGTGKLADDKPTTDITSSSTSAVYCPNDTQICCGGLAPKTQYRVIAISGLGASASSDIRYVTFMNDDGTVEYGKKPVAVGDDCADPISRGIFSTPTKESTAQYNYTFSGGWATEPNGGKDSNALKNVTEDRTVYANFIAAVRYYTITYYDSDGTTVLKTESLAYGAAPSYSPVKDGYKFNGWSPSLSTVIKDASYTAKWIESVAFADASWETIAAKSADGTASQMWAVGDAKNVDVNINGTLYPFVAKIVGFNHDTLSGSSKKAGISLLFFTVPATKYAFHSSNMYEGDSYYDCDIRTTVEGFKSKLPADLQSVIKQVSKVCNRAGKGNGVYVNKDCYMWIPSAIEIGSGSYNMMGQGLGARYEMFSGKYQGYGGTGFEVFDTTGAAVTIVWVRDVTPSQYVYDAHTLTTGTYFGTTNEKNTNYTAIGFCV